MNIDNIIRGRTQDRHHSKRVLTSKKKKRRVLEFISSKLGVVGGGRGYIEESEVCTTPIKFASPSLGLGILRRYA